MQEREKEVVFNMDDKGVKLMAVFIAQLTREGVTYRTHQGDSCYTISLTGGF
jgi:hypothetical protein